MNNLQKRIFTSIVLIAIVLNCLFISSITWLILLSIASLISLYEFFFIIKKVCKNILLAITIFTLSAFYLLFFINSALNIHKTNGEFFVLFILLIIIFSDIGGYVVGKFIGGVKLTKISPNKTISGSIGSFLFSLFPLGFSILIVNLSGINLGIYVSCYPVCLGIIEDSVVLCLVLSLVSQVGDLIISYFKRLAKVKDTGKFLPGHGGILDRIDGIIFAIPFYYFFWS
jgi:phosphatidate cytidylyltransferase